MARNLLLVLALAAIVGLPFLLRPRDSLLGQADETLVIITPHIEAIRYEYARGFRDWYKARTGKTVRIDWRVPGGTTEIARYLAGGYQAPFKSWWRDKQKMRWTEVARESFDDGKVKLGPDPAKDTEAQLARRLFLQSDAGIGIDLFFGGGSFDFSQQAAAGRLVDCGYVRDHPELFGDGPDQIPQTLGGEPFYDKEGRWIGVVLSSFGICYNDDALRRLHVTTPPKNWADLTDPVYFGQVALADPNMSGGVTKAFEMIVQQQIDRRVQRAPPGPVRDDDPLVAAGWKDAMELIQKIGAQTRYFTDSSTKMPIDVGDGDAAIGMSIDFYGRFQAESERAPDTGRERMHYFNPPGGTSIGVDPIGLLRGAPHPRLARAFVDYVLSLEGQKLWAFKVGAPGGPEKYALRRSPVRREIYVPELRAHRSDPDTLPYEEAKSFTYHPAWTAPLFNPIRFIVRAMCIDPHEEARDAWAAIVRANYPPEAMKAFANVEAVDYGEAKGRIAEALKNPDPIVQTRLSAKVSGGFREQYQRARQLAQAGK